MGAPSKRAKKVRQITEFELRTLVRKVLALRVSAGAYSWTLAEIQAARDAQMAGNFQRPARLAESFRTDDAMYVAHRNRLAPQRALPVKLVAANEGAKAKRIRDEADALYGPAGVGISPETLVEINSQLANHGVWFGINTATPRDDGSRIDLEMHAWPIEHVRWDAMRRAYVTRVDPECARLLGDAEAVHGELVITHGDGRWAVGQMREIEPWKDCCLLPGALTWSRHAFGLRDLSKGSKSHGNAKVTGQLPEGFGIDTAEGGAYLELLLAIAGDESPVGIEPFGSKTSYLTNNSGAWQIFVELIKSSEIAASRVYNGQDGSLGTNGTGPGIDLRALMGVTNDIVEGDLHCIERGILTGVIEPWCAMNFGDSTLAPRRVYEIPDADQDARREAAAKARERFYAAIEKERVLGFDVTAERIAELAEEHGITPAALAVVASEKPSVALAPTDIAKVVRVNEARASGGLGPLTLADGTPDPDGLLMVSAFSALLEARADAAASVPPVATPAPSPAPPSA